MEQVNLIRDLSSESYESILHERIKEKFKPGMKIAVKLHMGEGKGMFSPSLAKRTVAVLKELGCVPFLFDTPVVYPGPRNTKAGYEALAPKHGFSEENIGCPVVICDEYNTIKTDHMNMQVADVLKKSDGLIVLTHVKGHDCSGFGGSIKNLAMGCAAPSSKNDQHGLGLPTVNENNCTACKACEKVCAFGAIKVDDKAKINADSCAGCDNCVLACPHDALHCKVMFDTLLAEAASAAIKSMDGKPIFYVNDARNITKHCDCFANPGEPIMEDVGVFLSEDIVTIETATIDEINKSKGKNIFKIVNHHDPYLSIHEAERLKLGKKEYSLINS